MPLFSVFTPFGFLAFTSDPSPAEQIYNALTAQVIDPVTGVPAFSLDEGTDDGADLYASAMVLATARQDIDRAHNQNDPLKAYDLLPSLEADYKLIPGALDGVLERQRAVAARRRLPRGSRRESLVDVFRTLLGEEFLAYAVIPGSEADRYPAAPEASLLVNAKRVDLVARVVVLGDYVTEVDILLWVPYGNLDTAAAPLRLLVGETVMVQAGHTLAMEKVTVLGERAGASASAAREIQAVFTKAHEIGAVMTTQNWPFQTSMTSHALIVLTHAAAVDPVKRAKVDDQMQRIARGSHTWSIVSPSAETPTTVTTGPSRVDSTIGCVPVAELTVAKSL